MRLYKRVDVEEDSKRRNPPLAKALMDYSYMLNRSHQINGSKLDFPCGLSTLIYLHVSADDVTLVRVTTLVLVPRGKTPPPLSLCNGCQTPLLHL